MVRSFCLAIVEIIEGVLTGDDLGENWESTIVEIIEGVLTARAIVTFARSTIVEIIEGVLTIVNRDDT